MKIDLSSHTDGGAVVKEQCLGLPRDYLPTSIIEMCSKLKIIELTLTSDQYDKACHSLYDRSMIPIRKILNELNMDTDEIDEVVMVGGTTRMPQIRKLVLKETGLD